MPSNIRTPKIRKNLELSTQEKRLVLAWRTTTDRHQVEVLAFIEATAVACPRIIAPTLRLIVGGAA